MKIRLLRKDLEKYLIVHQLEGKFRKQKSLFEENPFHPSLETELLEPPESTENIAPFSSIADMKK